MSKEEKPELMTLPPGASIIPPHYNPMRPYHYSDSYAWRVALAIIALILSSIALILPLLLMMGVLR